MKYSNEERYFCVENYQNYNSFKFVQKLFEKKFNKKPPSKTGIRKLMRKFSRTYSLDDKRLTIKKRRSNTKINDENIVSIKLLIYIV